MLRVLPILALLGGLCLAGGGCQQNNDTQPSGHGGSSGSPSLSASPEPDIHPDVHSIEVHPSSPDLVYAPTGGGFFRSLDGGQTWKLSA